MPTGGSRLNPLSTGRKILALLLIWGALIIWVLAFPLLCVVDWLWPLKE